MRWRIPITLILALLGSSAGADEVYKWVDEEGRIHFSNRGEEAAPEPPVKKGEGWESVLERQEGADDFSRRAEVAINGLQADRLRKKRERNRAFDSLTTTQQSILRTPPTDAESLANLRKREEQQIAEVRRLDQELAQVDLALEKLRAIKAMGREQAEKLGASPFLEFGQ